jgi:hypothetical protein
MVDPECSTIRLGNRDRLAAVARASVPAVAALFALALVLGLTVGLTTSRPLLAMGIGGWPVVLAAGATVERYRTVGMKGIFLIVGYCVPVFVAVLVMSLIAVAGG